MIFSRLFSSRKTLPPHVDAVVKNANLHVTLWPAFPHFRRFAADKKIAGIRLNSAMMAASEFDMTFQHRCDKAVVPLWFDVKGMQLRIAEIVYGTDHDHLEIELTRPIECDTPCPVWFKAGEDCAKLVEIRGGTHLIFDGGPRFEVKAGESIHIRSPELRVGGPTFLPHELDKIERVKKSGIDKWYLSYVYSQKHVDDFRELIGDDQLILKIENKEGLLYAANEFKKDDKTSLMAARGDLFVEIEHPHQILNACRLVVAKDPEAFVGSRMLLSLVNGKGVPSSSDLCELAWLYDIGYRNFLLCDELCLKEELLAAACNVFGAIKRDYVLG